MPNIPTRIPIDPDDPSKGWLNTNPNIRSRWTSGNFPVQGPKGGFLPSISEYEGIARITKQMLQDEQKLRQLKWEEIKVYRELNSLENERAKNIQHATNLLKENKKNLDDVLKQAGLLGQSNMVILPGIGPVQKDVVNRSVSSRNRDAEQQKVYNAVVEGLAASGVGQGKTSAGSIAGGLGGLLGGGGRANEDILSLILHKSGFGSLAVPFVKRLGGGSMLGGLVRGAEIEAVSRMITKLTGGVIDPNNPLSTYRGLTSVGRMTGEGSGAGLATMFSGMKLGANPFDLISMQMAQEIVKGVRSKGFRGQIADAVAGSVGSIVNNLGINWEDALSTVDDTIRSGSNSLKEMNDKLASLTNLMDTFSITAKNTQQSVQNIVDSFNQLRGPALAQGGQKGVQTAGVIAQAFPDLFKNISKDQLTALNNLMLDPQLNRMFALMGGGNPLSPTADMTTLAQGMIKFLTTGPAGGLSSGEAVSLFPWLSGIQKGTLDQIKNVGKSGRANRVIKDVSRLSVIQEMNQAFSRAGPGLFDILTGDDKHSSQIKAALMQAKNNGVLTQDEVDTLMENFSSRESWISPLRHVKGKGRVRSPGHWADNVSFGEGISRSKIQADIVSSLGRFLATGQDPSKMTRDQLLTSLHLDKEEVQAIRSTPGLENVIKIVLELSPQAKKILSPKGQAQGKSALDSDYGVGRDHVTSHPYGKKR